MKSLGYGLTHLPNGMDPEKAAQVAFGRAGGISEALDKIMLLTALGIGGFLLLKKYVF